MSKDLPATIPDYGPDPDDTARFWEHYRKYQPLDSYKSMRESMAMLKFGVAHGLIDPRISNAQVYILSHVLMAYDRERVWEGKNSQDINSITNDKGEIALTQSQWTEVLQEPNMGMQVRIIERFNKENEQKGVAEYVKIEEVAEVVVEAAIKEAKNTNRWEF